MLFRKVAKSLVSPDDGWNSWREALGLLNSNYINLSGKNSLKEITVYTCVKILSESIAKLPQKIYKDNKKATEHYLYPLIKLRPNPYMSAYDEMKCVETQLNIYGNAYEWIETDRYGKIIGLYPLDSSKMQIYVDDVGLISSTNSVWYIYSDKLGNKYKIISDNILHYKNVTVDGIVGISPIEYLKHTIENAQNAKTFLKNTYERGLQTAGIVHYIGDLKPTAAENFRREFEKMSSGLKNANRISLLPVGYQYQPIALKLTDAQFLENTRFTLQQLTAAFGIKPHQINDQTKTSYASTSEANREFYTDTLLAKLTMYEQERTYKLFLNNEIEAGYYIKFNADVILRADISTRYEAYGKAIQNGFKTPNEIRALEEDEPLNGGDKLYMNGNMIAVQDIGKREAKNNGK